MGMSTKTKRPPAPIDPDWAELRARLRSFVARRVPHDPSVHDDLVQEILLRLYRALPRLRDTEALDAFAYRIARNAIVDHGRAGGRERPVSPDSLDDHALADDPEADDPEDAGRAQLARCLRPLAEHLGEDYREAVLLTDLGGVSQADAARRLGLSAPGMRSRVQRGRAQVREALGRCCSVELDAAGQIDRVERIGPCACSS